MRKLISIFLITAAFSTSAFAVDATPICFIVQAKKGNATNGFQSSSNAYSYDVQSNNNAYNDCVKLRNHINLLSSDKISVEAKCELQEYPSGNTNCSGEIQWRTWLLKTKIRQLSE